MQSTANDSHGASRRHDGRPQEGSPSDGPSPRHQPAPRAQTSTVYVIDDEPSIRGLLEAIAAGMGLKVQPHENAESFLKSYDPEVPGCLLLDIYLPSMNGHELLEEIGRRKWELSIVVMSGRAEVSDSVRAFRAGSLDFLEKPFDRATVEACIRSAIQKDLEARDHRAKQSEIKARIASLTPRETQVMELVVAGNSNKSIAAELGVSPKTVEVHRANVMHKMKADSLAALVKMAMEDGIATCELE